MGVTRLEPRWPWTTPHWHQGHRCQYSQILCESRVASQVATSGSPHSPSGMSLLPRRANRRASLNTGSPANGRPSELTHPDLAGCLWRGGCWTVE